MFALLGESGIVHDPRHEGAPLLYRREDGIPHLGHQFLITPGSIGNQMMHRLVQSLRVAGVKKRSHRLDALAVARKQESLAVGFERLDAVGVPYGISQAFEVCSKALLLRAWR
jgi:hypothetical protein